MAHFFRSTSPFFRTITSISTPLCISFGVASSVPTTNDAPAYVQDVFSKFDANYHQTLQNKKDLIEKQWKDIKHLHSDHTSTKTDMDATESTTISEESEEASVEEVTTIKATQSE